ncbi:MAG: sodium ion-translocating decarboxylase subunit beta, partial [Erysipelotrichaceae bacterium]|nr:sodium ion-translocating decarboxylase subunit beta [Erysipelotrichaceae bacterium]
MSFLYENLFALTWQQVTMWVVGGILIYLAIKKDMEPSLLLPIGFGAILVNLPFSGAVNQYINGVFQEGPLSTL